MPIIHARSEAERTQDLAIAVFTRAFGSALFESGAKVPNDAAMTTNSVISAENTTSMSKDLNIAQRLHLGFRAMLADANKGVFGKGEYTIERDLNTLRMTDVTIFRELRAELKQITEDIARNEPGVEREGNRALMRRFQEVLGRSNMDDKEAEALTKVLETVLRVGSKANLQGDQYREELQRLYSGGQFDTQYEKVREDAKHRWVAFYQNLAISSASKALAIVSAPIGGFLAATFGVAAVETAGQGMTKWNMENQSLSKKIRDLDSALNKELQGFDTVDPKNVINPKPLLDGLNGRPLQANQSYDPAGADPLQRALAPKDAYAAALSAHRAAESIHASNPSEASSQALDQAWNSLARSAFLYVSNADRVKNLLETGGKLSMATRQRYEEVQETADSIVNQLKVLHRARFGEEFTRETFCQALQYSSSAGTPSLVREDPMVVHADFVSRVHEEERGNLESFKEAKIKEVRDQVLDWKRNVAQFTLNSFGNAMAIFSAGIRAIPDTDALRGTQAIPVVDRFMKLEDYISEHATKTFNRVTGLDKFMPFELGDAIGGAVGKRYAELTSWTGHLLHQTSKSGFDLLSVADKWDSFNEIWDKTSPQVGDFLEGRTARNFHFSAGEQTMQKACELVANAGKAGAGFLAAVSSLVASRVDRTTHSTYRFQQGFLPPVFVDEQRTPPVQPPHEERKIENGGGQIGNGSGQIGNGSGGTGEYPHQWPGVDQGRFGSYRGAGSNPYTGTFLGIRPDVLAERGLGEDGQPLPKNEVPAEPSGATSAQENSEPNREGATASTVANGSGGTGHYAHQWSGLDHSRFGSYWGPGASQFTGTYMGIRPDVLAERGLGEDGQPLQTNAPVAEVSSPTLAASKMKEVTGANDQPYSPTRARIYHFEGDLEPFTIGFGNGAWGNPDAREKKIEFKVHAGVDPRIPSGVNPGAAYMDVTKSDQEWRQIIQDEEKLLRILTLACEDLREGRSLRAFDDYLNATR